MKWLKNSLKIVFILAVFVFLAKKGFLSLEQTQGALMQWQFTLPAFLIFICTTLITFLRWQILAKAQGIRLPFKKTAELSMVGLFFNVALPGSVSGDIVKAFYIGKGEKGRGSKALGSILFDRVAGLSALMIVCALGFALSLENDLGEGSRLFGALQVFVVSIAAFFVFFYAYLFLVTERRDIVLQVLNWLEQKNKVFGKFRQLYVGLKHYHNHRIEVLKAISLSVLIHLAVCFAFMLMLRALGENEVGTTSAFVVVPLGLLVTAIPLTPAGVGTGHMAFSGLFHLLGTERGADVFTLYVLMQLVIAGFGGLVYLRFKGHNQEAPLLHTPTG